jgi:hypothetical protein
MGQGKGQIGRILDRIPSSIRTLRSTRMEEINHSDA